MAKGFGPKDRWLLLQVAMAKEVLPIEHDR